MLDADKEHMKIKCPTLTVNLHLVMSPSSLISPLTPLDLLLLEMLTKIMSDLLEDPCDIFYFA